MITCGDLLGKEVPGALSRVKRIWKFSGPVLFWMNTRISAGYHEPAMHLEASSTKNEEETMETTEQRLGRLEKQNHRLMWIGGAILAAFVTMAMAEGIEPYIVYDSKDTRRADFGVTNTARQSPGINFYNVNGVKRLFVGLTREDEPIIYFYNSRGEPQMYLNVEILQDIIPLVESDLDFLDEKQEKKLPTKILWPEDKKVFYVNSSVERPTQFHSPDCEKLDLKMRRRRNVAELKKLGLVPCPICLDHLYGED